MGAVGGEVWAYTPEVGGNQPIFLAVGVILVAWEIGKLVPPNLLRWERQGLPQLLAALIPHSPLQPRTLISFRVRGLKG